VGVFYSGEPCETTKRCLPPDDEMGTIQVRYEFVSYSLKESLTNIERLINEQSEKGWRVHSIVVINEGIQLGVLYEESRT
jgi:hypothetical protein